jgi:hypothetical protein
MKPLKFLGLVYEPSEDVIKAMTRGNPDKKPSRLKLEKCIFVKIKKTNGISQKKVINHEELLLENRPIMLSSGSTINCFDGIFGGLTEEVGLLEEKDFRMR